MTLNYPDRLLPCDTFTRGLARELFENIEGLPIISPHGHCDPSWFSENKDSQIQLSFLLYLIIMYCECWLAKDHLSELEWKLDDSFFEKTLEKFGKSLAKITTFFVVPLQHYGLIILSKKFLELLSL